MPLRNWAEAALQGEEADRVALRLRIPTGTRDVRAKLIAERYPSDDLLDLVDAILALGGPWPPRLHVDFPFQYEDKQTRLRDQLATILDEGSSVYRINDDHIGLVKRVDPTTTATFTSAVAAANAAQTAGSASEQLQRAWDALYGLHPDPPAAYRAAVQAVESAAHATIQPNHASATLGTMIRQLRDRRQDYALAIPGPDGSGDIGPLIEMMALLWKGQTSRHGSQTPTREETPPEAEMAVHLAVLLVHWLVTGAFRRKP